jgi:hypothetical protein
MSGDFRFWQIVLKNSKAAGLHNLANVADWRSRPLHGSEESRRGLAIAFSVLHMVSRLAARDTLQRS